MLFLNRELFLIALIYIKIARLWPISLRNFSTIRYLSTFNLIYYIKTNNFQILFFQTVHFHENILKTNDIAVVENKIFQCIKDYISQKIQILNSWIFIIMQLLIRTLGYYNNFYTHTLYNMNNFDSVLINNYFIY